MPIPLLLATMLLVSLYAWVIRRSNRILMRLPFFKPTGMSVETVSVVIAARNEVLHIGKCLDSLLQQTLPASQVEIIVVDDASEDDTATVVKGYAHRGVRLIQLDGRTDGAGKKAALQQGIAAASHGIIVATDADCSFHPEWLNAMLLFRETHQAVFVAGPVRYTREQGFLDRFQSLDFIALQGITVAAVSARLFNMCNGANLLYTKEAFQKVNGFAGIDHIATGDDMLLMEKIDAAYPGKVKYCFSREAIVETLPAAGWKAFIQQRIRWASKSTAYKSVKIKWVLLLVYLVNLCLFGMMLLAPLGFNHLKTALLMILIKTIVEYPLMIRMARFLGKAYILPWFMVAQPFHIIYTVLSASLSFFRRYEWKGRNFK